MESMDLIVIGAGFNGLPVAKTYREVHPTAKLLVIDASETIGGTWAKHRLYPGLKSNSMVGTYEYSDFPMDEATFGVKPGEFIPGNVVHEYLRKYAEHFDVYRQIRFGVTVQTLEKVEGEGEGGGGDGGWILTTTKSGSGTQLPVLHTRKLVIATGLTSTPNLPSFPGSPSFTAPVFHSRDFLQNADTLKTATGVTVLGGTKSAWDVAYEYAAHGVPVDMIIRSTGHGPIWMAPPYVTPLKRWLEKLIHTRFLTWFSPCVWGEAHGFGGVMRRVLHGTCIGRGLVRTFWGVLGKDVMTLNGYHKHPETAKLKPWTNPFWMGATGLGILNYPTDFFELVRNGMIKVHIADITHLSPRAVHLDTGLEVPADALICATGWKYKPHIKFVPESLQSSLGLPSAFDGDQTLTTEADDEILRRFPSLRNQPRPDSSYKPLATTDPNHILLPTTPYRLYRFMVPPAFIGDRSIAFAGVMMTVSTPLIAQTQALWITAYFAPSFDKKNNGNDVELPVPNLEQAKHEALLHTEFCKLRYPQGFGSRFPDFSFDALPYLDLLLRDLGLRGRRKGWWRDWWAAYGPEDYRGLVREWQVKRG